MEIRLTSSGQISQGAKALDILHKLQADLQGKNIIPEKFSDRIIFMSMINDIELERKDNEDSCALTLGKVKEYASTFNDGHWAFLGHGEESNRYQGYAAEYGGQVGSSCVTNGGNFREFRTSSIPGGKPTGPWNSQEEELIEKPFFSMENMAILTCCAGLFMPRTSAVSAGQSQRGVDRIPEKQAKADPKAFARFPQKFK